MKNPKPYVRKKGKNWKGILVGNKDDGKGRRCIVILGQPHKGFKTQQEAAQFVRTKWKRLQDMVAFASKAGNGSALLSKEVVREVRFQLGHPLYRGAKVVTNKPSFTTPEFTIDTYKNAIEFIIASAGINGRMVNEQEATNILDAISKVIFQEHDLPKEELLESLSDAYLDQQALLARDHPSEMKQEDVLAQLRYLNIRKAQLEQHIE